MNKLIFLIALFLSVEIGSCDDKEYKYTKNDDQSIVGTWKCIGFGNTETNEIKPIEPQDCEKCYTITFKENGTFEGKSFINVFSGSYTVNTREIKIKNTVGTEVGEMGDAGIFINGKQTPNKYI